MMKQCLGSILTMMLMATAAIAQPGSDDASPSAATTYAAEPLAVLTSYNPYAQPTVALLSSNRADVLQAMSDMRAKLDDFSSLALNNGITQTADAFVAHWNLAVAYNVDAGHDAVQSMIGDMVTQNSYLIQDFLLTPKNPVEGSLFTQASFTGSVASVPSGGFFAQ